MAAREDVNLSCRIRIYSGEFSECSNVYGLSISMAGP